jgi:hypothetical protein
LVALSSTPTTTVAAATATAAAATSASATWLLLLLLLLLHCHRWPSSVPHHRRRHLLHLLHRCLCLLQRCRLSAAWRQHQRSTAQQHVGRRVSERGRGNTGRRGSVLRTSAVQPERHSLRPQAAQK